MRTNDPCSYMQITIIPIRNPPELSATLSALGPFIQNLGGLYTISVNCYRPIGTMLRFAVSSLQPGR